MNDKRLKMLSEYPVWKAIFSMSIPVVAGMMVQVLYNFIDIYFIGMLKDPDALAAANLTTPLFMMMMAISGVIGTGAASCISRCLGESNGEKAGKALSSGMIICLCLGLLSALLGSLFIEPIVKALGANSETFPFARDFSIVLLLGAAFIMCNFALSQLIRSEGSVVVSMLGMLIGTVANAVLDPIFIFTFNMGVKGAALATVLGNALGLAYYIVFYLRGKSLVKFRLGSVLPQKDIMKEIFSIGIPASVSQLLMGIAVMLCNNLAVLYGNHVIAGMGIASKLMTAGTFIFMGFSVGCQPLIGYNFGAKNDVRVKNIIKTGMLITSMIGIVITVVFIFFAKECISVFTPIEDVAKSGAFILRGLAWSLPVYGAQMVGAVTVQAMGKGRASLLISVARQGIFYIPILFLLNSSFGLNGLIFAQPLTDLLAFLVTLGILKYIYSATKTQRSQPCLSE